MKREPLYFGQPDQELYGVLHDAPGAADCRHAVVLCGSIGIDSINAHRAMRSLADALAASGLRVLRFDYRGTGNSTEPRGGAITWSTLLADLRSALQFASETADVTRLHLVGVRFGALLASEAAAEIEAESLTFWAPITAGRKFAREWSMFARHAGSTDEAGDGMVHAVGFGLHRDFLEELGSKKILARPVSGSPQVLLVEREDFPPEDRLLKQLNDAGLSVERIRPGDFSAGLVAEPHEAVLPTESISSIRQWIEARASTTSSNGRDHGGERAAQEERKGSIALRPDDAFAVSERFLDQETTGGLFGIISEPIEETNWNRTDLILLNGGSVHHIGPNRMHVDFARQFAGQGLRVCRADLAGLGESAGTLEPTENGLYAPDTTKMVDKILQALATDATPSRVIVGGLCSGAWAGFHAALDIDSIDEIILLNPDFYGERSVKPLAEEPAKSAGRDHYKRFAHYRASFLRAATWKKLVRGQIDLGRVFGVLRKQIRLEFAAYRAKRSGDLHRLEIDLARLAAARVQVSVVFSQGDSSIDFLRLHGRYGVERLRAAGLFRQVTIDDTDHPFTPPAARKQLLEHLTHWLVPE